MRLIDADALSEKIEALMNRYAAQGRTEVAEDYNFVLTVLMTAETIDPESLRPKGRWRLNKDGSGTCNLCRITTKDVWDMDNWTNYCPHCGARMEG